MPRPQIKRETRRVDAAGRPLGRLASEIARLLIGKHKADYAPNVDAGAIVEVENIDKLVLTGKKRDQKVYYSYSGYPGGLKRRSYADLESKETGRALRRAVDRMLPKNTFRSRRLKRLRIVK